MNIGSLQGTDPKPVSGTAAPALSWGWKLLGIHRDLPPFHHPVSRDLPWNKPSIWGVPPFMEIPKNQPQAARFLLISTGLLAITSSKKRIIGSGRVCWKKHTAKCCRLVFTSSCFTYFLPCFASWLKMLTQVVKCWAHSQDSEKKLRAACSTVDCVNAEARCSEGNAHQILI